ncbi:probable U3 small nucleolar RNA-associated protein 11 [Latimeria chalumnae]|uniref:probable U3 small nucleolar RNA-associated protein 11 n=1 Tax=Latimeria chalumnae TaxID=7897 RepID=UPI0006D8F487|nr:PREDICTED: probable U3 small nucleolar RNA-associated protein 11 [Latimeria chalumnae]|eukprot:XP_014353285.1 PREDICTED: probable U3 small nucleolar RNA-associated protein 11 [Latimeria chalumnae]
MAAAFRKAQKSRQKNHQERQQLGFRKHLGLLEKKKDYKLRADDFHKKQNTLRALRKKALDKNPDEFYFKMTSTQLQDGVHVIKQPKEELTEEQLKVMRTQDLKYVELKRVAEGKKIERLKSELHLLEAEGKQPNKHLFFLDTKKEVEQFDLATHLKTAPELVDRVYNRPTIETLRTETVKGATNPFQLQKLARQRKRQYSILKQRIEREKKMFVIEQKLQTRKDLMDKTHKVKVKKETVDSPAIYKFKFQRKR